jgi:hypothetical protein
MSAVAAPAFLPRKIRLAKLALLLLFVSLMSFAAVRQMKIECEPNLLGSGIGTAPLATKGGLLGAGAEQCYVTAGASRVPLPAWLSRILR